MKVQLWTSTLLSALAAVSLLSAQDEVINLQDLRGRSKSTVEREMRSRGFQYVRSDRAYTYYRESRSERCVVTYFEDNRLASATYMPESDCRGSYGGGSGGGANSVQDLVGSRGRDGEYQLQQRGWTMARSKTGGNSIAQFWRRRGECLEAILTDGRYSDLHYVDRSSCDDGGFGGSGGSGGFGGGGGSWGGSGGSDWSSGNWDSHNAPRVRVDTGGRGQFSSDARRFQLNRARVDTQGTPTVTVEGGGDDSITFRGDITSSDGRRSATIRIRESNRGSASGTITFRLNGDRNEVESVTITGRLNGRSMSANFSR